MQYSRLLRYASASSTQLTMADRLFEERVIMLDCPIDSAVATEVISMLSCLNIESHDPIHFYLNSPGGSISDGLAIVDCMRGIASPVCTHALGIAASMASVILACGEPGLRFVAPSAEVMVHQPLTIGNGTMSADGLAESAMRILDKKSQINAILVAATGLSVERVDEILARDTWLNAAEALDCGFVDQIETNWMSFLKGETWE